MHSRDWTNQRASFRADDRRGSRSRARRVRDVAARSKRSRSRKAIEMNGERVRVAVTCRLHSSPETIAPNFLSLGVLSARLLLPLLERERRGEKRLLIVKKMRARACSETAAEYAPRMRTVIFKALGSAFN